MFSCEQVSKFHPDKYADQISDACVTECLRQDKNSHCSVETMVQGTTVVLSGNVTTNAKINYDEIVRMVAKKLRYNVDKIINLITPQSPEINKAVSAPSKIGAGDQGIIYGYAVNGAGYLPSPFMLANEVIKLIEDDVDNNPDSILMGDAKTQITFDDSKVVHLLISACHKPDTFADLKPYILSLLNNHPIGEEFAKATISINPAGSWTIGGATADCGVTGRKIICDTYGGFCPHGGGAFSGKDPTKVDRSAAYMARKIAVDLLKENPYAERCAIQLAYQIGVPEPVSVLVDLNDPSKPRRHGFGTMDLDEYVKKTYDLTPKGMIDALDLLNVDYEKLAEGCHFRYLNFPKM